MLSAALANSAIGEPALRSSWLDIRCPNNFGPFFSLQGHERSEFGRRGHERLAAEIPYQRVESRIDESGIHRAVD
jgi:hypothetical protein